MNTLDKEQLAIFQRLGNLHAELTALLVMASALTCHEPYSRTGIDCAEQMTDMTRAFTGKYRQFLGALYGYFEKVAKLKGDETIH